MLLNPRKILRKQFWTRLEKTRKYLETLEQKTNYEKPVPPLGLRRKDCSSREDLWARFREAADGMEYPVLLWSFELHCEALPLIPLRNRSIGSQECNPDLDAHLRERFLPKVFSLIDTYLSDWNLDLDLDGNIFIAILGILLSDTSSSLSQRLGDSLSRIAFSIPPPPGDPPHSHLETLGSAFPFQVSRSQPRPLAAPPKKLLPFHHDVFNEGFSLIDLPSDNSDEIVEYGALEFGRDTAFNDRYHWHNAKRHILPKHLGGEQSKPSDEVQRARMMKRQQWFMSELTGDAATLTGALGARFNRIIIVTNKARGKHSGNPVCYVVGGILSLGTNAHFIG